MMSRFLEEVILESNCLMEPAAVLRGLAYVGIPNSMRSLFNLWNSSVGIYTSPLTSSTPDMLFNSISGMLFIVLRFAVTFSPTFPSPRVAPSIKEPS